MKTKLSFLMLLLCHFLMQAQTPDENLNKYWNQRDRFRKVFTWIGKERGNSLPFYRGTNGGANVICHDTDRTHRDNYIIGGDVTLKLGFYLSTLATEYKLLKRNNQDVTATLNELYYALEALNRLDQKAEWYHRLRQGPDNDPVDLNGFFLRDDIPTDMKTKFKRENYEQINTAFECEYCKDPNTCEPVTYHKENEESIDQFAYLLMGFALIAKNVDDVYVQPTPGDRGFKVVTETRVITDRLINYIKSVKTYTIEFDLDFGKMEADLLKAYQQSSTGQKILVLGTAVLLGADAYIAFEANLLLDRAQIIHALALANGPEEFRKQRIKLEVRGNWFITNPVSGLNVSNDGGNCQFVSYLIAKTGQKITGKDYFDPIVFNSECKNTNPHVQNIFSNVNAFIPIAEGSDFANIWNGIGANSELIEKPHVVNGHEQHDKLKLKVKDAFATQLLDITKDINFSSTSLKWFFNCANIFGALGADVEFVWDIAFNKPPREDLVVPIEHLYSLEIADVLAATAGIWTFSQFQNQANVAHLQPLDLLYAQLNDISISNANTVNFGSFSSILNTAPCDGFNRFKPLDYEDRTAFEKFSVWGYGYSTDDKRNEGAKDTKVDGMEYCLFYNLYHGQFVNQLSGSPYYNNACPCSNFDEIFVNTTEVNTNWKNPLIYDPNNSSVSRRRFPDYHEKGIFIPDFLKHDLVVNNGGVLNADFDFAVCNNAQVFVNPGGTLAVGSSLSSITPSETRIKKYSSLLLYDNSVLIINNGSKLVIEDGATLVISGSPLIILNGSDAVLEIKGNINILDNSVFSFTGEGFIKYNVNSWQNKIQMGANASIDLQGLDARNHKILEVTNSLFSVDNNGTNKVTIKNGRVDIADYSFLNIACALTVENAVIRGINLTQKHRGIATYGQTGIRIKNSTFEYGEYGVRSLNYFTSNSLIIDGCTFLNNTTGIYSYARGITIKNCLFNSNTKNWSADAMDFSSKYTYNSAMNTATAGIEYTGNQNLDVYSNPLIETRGSGIINRGSTLHVGCTTIKPSPINKSFIIGEGIYADAYSSVYICPTASRQLDGNNSITEFPVSIYTHRIVSLNLANGGNNIGSNTLNSSFANRVDIEGSMYPPPTINNPVIAANKNMWYNTSALSPLNVPASYNPSAPQNYFNYFLFTAPTGSLQFTFTDNAVKTTPGINCPLTVNFPPYEALDMNLQPYFNGNAQNQVESILQGMGNAYADSTSPVAAVVSNWKNFIVSTWNTTPTLQTRLGLLQYAYPQQKEAFGRAGLQNEMVLYPGETPQWVLDYIYTQEFLLDHMDTSEAYYPVRFGLALDNAIVYRTIKDYTQALDKLSQLRNWASAKDMALIDYWNCAFTNEQKVMNNEISVDELVSNVNSCRPEILHENLVFNTNVPQTTDSVFEAFTLSPNPASDILTVDFNPALTGPTIVEVRNAFGSLVKRIELTIDPTEHTLPVPVGELSAGTYQLLVRNADGVYSKVFVKM